MILRRALGGCYRCRCLVRRYSTDDRVTLHSLLQDAATPAQRTLAWRAWSGLSQDLQATRHQLLHAMLGVLTTDQKQDALRLLTVLDSKEDADQLDAKQRLFYGFWAYSVLGETQRAWQSYASLDVQLQARHAQIFMNRVVEVGDWLTGVRIWHAVNRVRVDELLLLIPNVETFQFLGHLPGDVGVFRERIRREVVVHLNRINKTGAAYTLLKHAYEQGSRISQTELGTTLFKLSPQKKLTLFDMASGPFNHRIYMAAISACSQLGKIDQAKRILDQYLEEKAYFRDVRPSQDNKRDALTLVMSGYARRGLVDEVEALYTQFEGEADAYMLGTRIHAAVMQVDLNRATLLFKEASALVKPDRVLYNMLLHIQSDVMDADAASQTFSALLDAGFVPSAYTASIMIDLFAHKRDAVGAQRVFDEMEGRGVVFNSVVYGSLMNAYVEAGDTTGMRRVVEQMQEKGIPPNSKTMNIVLKSYLREERPVADSQALVDAMEKTGIQATDITFSHFLQSHVRRDDMRGAVKTFKKMLDSGLAPNEYHYTIMMLGFVKIRQLARVTEWYEDMLKAGIKPTFATHAVLLNALVERKTRETVRIAEGMLDAILAAPGLDITSRFAPKFIAPPDVYNPVIKDRALRIDIKGATRLFREFLKTVAETTSRPNVRMLTYILKCYALAGETDAVRTLFVAAKKDVDRMYRLKRGPQLTQVAKGARFLLSQPLTVFMSHMKQDGHYDEIERVWHSMLLQGYAFDATNWNLYVQALLDAGKIERAFAATESMDMRVYNKTREQLVGAAALLQSGSVVQTEYGLEEGLEVWRRLSSRFPETSKLADATTTTAEETQTA